MTPLSLDGDWTLHYHPAPSRPAESLDDAKARGYRTVPAVVPGSVELDLMRAGVLPDLFTGDNIRRAWDLEYGDWWLERRFTLPVDWDTAEPLQLQFDGLDTFADVYLNDEHLGTTDNMLVAHSFDATALRAGENHLVVHIRSTMLEAERYEYAPQERDVFLHLEGLHVRKAPHMFGWNIAPRLVSAGIWRSVSLGVPKHAHIRDLYVHTKELDLDRAYAILNCHFQLASGPRGRKWSLRVRGTALDEASRFEAEVPITFKAQTFDIRVDEPTVWWPRPMGRPSLYRVEFELLDEKGHHLETRVETIGLRTIELDQSDGAFRFVVNGCAIDILGTNWVPLDALHGRDRERQHGALKLLDDSRCNLVRVWGGGVYEEDSFYEWCDTNGVLVWQDFAFSCAYYPQGDDFLSRVEAEASSVVRRLRNHASLAVWAGNNENDQVLLDGGFDPDEDMISRQVLKRTCNRYDPARIYLPSAPYIPGSVADRLQVADQHLWGFPPFYKDPEYSRNSARFIGEIGFYGSPDKKTLEHIAGRIELPRSDDDAWRLHETTDLRQPDVTPRLPIDVMIGQAEFMFGRALDNVDDFILASQAAQAEAFKYVIEMTRSDDLRSGVVWWSLFDTWPGISASVASYSFVRKLAFAHIRTSQAPLCLMVRDRADWGLELVARNDTREVLTARYSVVDSDTRETLAEGELIVPATSSVRESGVPVGLRGSRLLEIRWTSELGEGTNHYLDGLPPFDLERYREKWLPAILNLSA